MELTFYFRVQIDKAKALILSMEGENLDEALANATFCYGELPFKLVDFACKKALPAIRTIQ